jgi:Na+-driven multidrug efflux pump
MDMKNLNWKLIAIGVVIAIVIGVVIYVINDKITKPLLSKSSFSMKPTAVAPSATPAPVVAPVASSYAG